MWRTTVEYFLQDMQNFFYLHFLFFIISPVLIVRPTCAYIRNILEVTVGCSFYDWFWLLHDVTWNKLVMNISCCWLFYAVFCVFATKGECLLVIVLPTNCFSLSGKHLPVIPLSLATSLSLFLTIFHPDPCVLPIEVSLPDHTVLLATFPFWPFLFCTFCLELSAYRDPIHL